MAKGVTPKLHLRMPASQMTEEILASIMHKGAWNIKMSELYERIPNNVNLSDTPKLQRALEHWLPDYLTWWQEMGPDGFQEDQIYLRTAVSVEASGWAHFDYVKMPDYRWGIFLTPPERKTITFGDHAGKDVWNEVPGEFRKDLRRLIVTQADTEPASVEQQRHLGKTAPSLYDLRNLFQVNVEEGRHLWAMVYLLHSFFGRDGRDEADELLARRSGHQDSPRILEAFNEPIDNWLDFFCFTMFTDRDGKYQLAALAESAFDPLARSTQFMLTEEAHHLFVGETGISRIIKRTLELMHEDSNEDIREAGGVPLDLLQKYINRWYSACLDLFGSEDSSNAAIYFSQSLKGRFRESKDDNIQDHMALEGYYAMTCPTPNGPPDNKEIPLRRAMNCCLQDSYTKDCARALRKWNALIKRAGVNFELTLPSRYFNRGIGFFANMSFTPSGELLTQEEDSAQRKAFLPSKEDRAYVDSLMVRATQPGEIANWIAPPTQGINNQPIDFEYVKSKG